MRMTTEQAINILDAAITNGIIYNVDFVAAKERLNRNFELASRDVQQVHLSNRGTDAEESNTAIYYDVSSGLHNFPSKKFVKLLANATASPVLDAANGLVAEWSPVAAKLKAVKPLIIKGRKPSDKPRTTPARTIENTGTCAVCGQNVKLDKGGNIVSHGYRVVYHSHPGNCFGVGYKPIEVSNEGLVAYVEMLENTLTAEKAKLADIPAEITGYSPEARKIRAARHNAEQMIRWLTVDIDNRKNDITKWEARPLPEAA